VFQKFENTGDCMFDNCFERDASQPVRNKYSVFGTKELTLEVEADSPQAAAATMREQGFSPVSVEKLDDGVFVTDWQCIGRCEACGKELFQGDSYVMFADGPFICAEHE
jgi:hypothetical protein